MRWWLRREPWHVKYTRVAVRVGSEWGPWILILLLLIALVVSLRRNSVRRVCNSREKSLTIRSNHRPSSPRVWRPGAPLPVASLFRRGSRKQRKEKTKILETVPVIQGFEPNQNGPTDDSESRICAEAMVESLDDSEPSKVGESIQGLAPVSPFSPGTREQSPRLIPLFVLGGAMVAMAGYLLYRFVSKAISKENAKVEYDFDDVIVQLKRLKRMRLEPDMSEADILRVRSYMVYLVVKQKKKNPVHVLHKVLELLGQKTLTDTEMNLLFNTGESVRVRALENEETAIVEPKVISEAASRENNSGLSGGMKEVSLISSAFDPDADAQWWHRIPYICILQMKRSRAFFMTNLPEMESDEFALLGFEDPAEAFHAGKMPAHQQFWGSLTEMGSQGAKPSRPLEGEKHFDLTWVKPGEFNALMAAAGCYGLVIPAGTLRTPQLQGPIPVRLIKSTIEEVATDEIIGPTKAISIAPERFSSRNGSANGVIGDKVSPTPIGGNNGADSDGASEDNANRNEIGELAEELGLAENCLDDLTPQRLTANGVNGADTESAAVKETRQDLPTNGNVPLSNGATINDFPPETPRVRMPNPKRRLDENLWWLDLSTVFVPRIKPPDGSAGIAEINISIEPEEKDFRLVLFEDERDAKCFLGVAGHLRDPDTLVGITDENPWQFLRSNPNLDRNKIIVLCPGALLLDRYADNDGVRYAVRRAHKATEIKKGINQCYPPGSGQPLDEDMLKMAGIFVDSVSEVMQHNIKTGSKEGDPEYLDPLQGFIKELDKDGVFDIFEPPVEDGISSTVGDSDSDNPFSNYSASDSEPERGSYDEFVAKMAMTMTSAQRNVQHSTPFHAPPQEEKEVELEANFSDLISEEKEKERIWEKKQDEVEVYYPNNDDNRQSYTPGKLWFANLGVVYLPMLLSDTEEVTYVATSHPDTGRKLIVAFQDPDDARGCERMIAKWPEKDSIAANTTPMPAKSFIEFCEMEDIDPVVIRRSAISISVNMTESEFLSHVVVIAAAQSTEFPIFNP